MFLDQAHQLAVSMRIILGKSMDECGGVNGRIRNLWALELREAGSQDKQLVEASEVSMKYHNV